MARILGLVTIKVGPVASDGGMGTSLTAIGDTVKGSAVFNESDPTKQEFFIEESDDAVESFVSQKGIESINWSTYNTNPANLVRLFGGVATLFKTIATLGTIVPGSGYANGTYKNVPLTGGSGSGATADITVASGAITVVTPVNTGEGYTVADSLTASNTNLGGTGTGFAVPIATLANGSASKSTWTPPDTQAEVEASVEVTDRKGNKFQFVRVKLISKKNLSFDATKLGQIDITGTILTPTKSGQAKYLFTAA